MAMEHSQQPSTHSIHDIIHTYDPSSDQAKMEIMLLKIAMDAVDAYNHVCKEHHIELISMKENSVLSEVDNVIETQRNNHTQSDTYESEDYANQDIADEEAMAVLSGALSDENTSQAAEISVDTNDLNDSNENNENVTAEMISDMISGQEEADEMPPSDMEAMEASVSDTANIADANIEAQAEAQNNSAKEASPSDAENISTEHTEQDAVAFEKHTAPSLEATATLEPIGFSEPGEVNIDESSKDIVQDDAVAVQADDASVAIEAETANIEQPLDMDSPTPQATAQAAQQTEAKADIAAQAAPVEAAPTSSDDANAQLAPEQAENETTNIEQTTTPVAGDQNNENA